MPCLLCLSVPVSLGSYHLVRTMYSPLISSPSLDCNTTVEGSEVMLFGVSQRYKESANCRLELQYGMEMQKSMIPLMMQQGYKATGRQARCAG